MAANAGILALLSRQDGLITSAQAIQHGMAEGTLRRRVRHDGWKRIAPRVFLAGGHLLTDRARIRAAGLWAGNRGVISATAAAWWHAMTPTAPVEIEVTVPRRSGLRAYPGIRVRRRDLTAADQLGTDGVWLTDKPLTALETAIAIPEGSVFLDRALQEHVRFEQAYRAYCRNLGMNGSAQMAVVLTAAADRADSAAERVLIALLQKAGLTGWECGRPFGRWTIDFAFPATMVAIEVDGWAWHMDVERLRADRYKGNALVRARWELLRFTWHDLINRPDYVIGEIRAALTAAVRVL